MVGKSKKLLKRSAIGFVIVLMVLFLAYMIMRNNIHTVQAGGLYRSAQLSPSRLKRLIRQDHIRTIINLRGPNPKFAWYRHELSVSRAMSVRHYDIQLSSTQLPASAQLKRLVHLFKTAPKPILIHCQGGADRTGFASSMWLLMHGSPLVEARDAFSILYFVHRSDSIGKQVFPFYVHWLGHHHYKQTPSHFMQWAQSVDFGKPQ